MSEEGVKSPWSYCIWVLGTKVGFSVGQGLVLLLWKLTDRNVESKVWVLPHPAADDACSGRWIVKPAGSDRNALRCESAPNNHMRMLTSSKCLH